MKRPFYFFLLMLMLLPLATTAQTSKQITLTYSQDDFVLDYDSLNQLAIYSYKHLSSFDEDTLKPALPYIAAYVMIGKNQSYNGFSYTSTELSVLSNVMMAPNPIAVPTSMVSTAPMGTMSVSFPNTLYPDSNVIYTGTHLMDGCKMLSFLICPYKYNNASHTLSFVSELNITISLTTETAPPPSLTVTRKRLARQVAHGMAANNNETDSLFNTIQETPDPADHCEYLIITCDSLVNAFQPLADWKTQKGVKTEIVTVEHIDSTYNESTPQLKIKRCIKDYHDNKNLQYVLLGGDDAIVPVQGCYAHYDAQTSSGEPKSVTLTNMPTDLFYSSLEGNFNWDANQNGIVGEILDGISLASNVFVSRIPLRSAIHVQMFVNRILLYECTPPIEDWTSSIFMGGKDLRYAHPQGQSDASIKGKNFYDNYINPYWNGTLVRFYDTVSDVEPAYSEFTRDNLSYHLSKGFPFVDIITHGNPKFWSMSDFSFGENNVNLIFNSRPSIIATLACDTNWFDGGDTYDPCLSEMFIRHDDSNIIAYFGCSRNGLTKVGKAGGESDDFLSSFYKSLFSPQLHNKKWGEVTAKAKEQQIAMAAIYDHHRWLIFGFNPMGDSEMPVFINQPLLFNNANAFLQNGTVVVNTGVDSCRVCVMSLEDKGATYYNVVDNVKTVTFNDIPVTSTICITKQGYVPKIFKLVKDNHLYIQNETIEDNVIINANQVDAGHDVTTEKEEGPVVIENGTNVKIHGSNGVYIKNSFEVKKGATLEIK